MRNTAERDNPGDAHPNRSLRLLAPAKINLHLRVGPRRSDGFHPLLTWMATIGLFDSLSLTLDFTRNRSDGVVMSSDDPSLPCDHRNLVVKAANLFREERPSMPAVSIHLEKRVPAGGGLGGGSSDAASTLLGLNRLWVKTVGEAVASTRAAQRAVEGTEELRGLCEMASRLGSDVPFFLYGPSSICKGRGEAVRPIGGPERAKWVTLVLPPMAMPTADVYRRFDAMNLGREQDIEREPGWDEWVKLGSRSLLAQLVNDLEPPAFALRPDLGELRTAIERSLDRPVRMSGSGSSLFTLFDEREEAHAAAEQIAANHGVRAVAVELSVQRNPNDETRIPE